MEGVGDAKEMAPTRWACTLLGNEMLFFSSYKQCFFDSGILSLECWLVCVKCGVLSGDLTFLIQHV